MKQSTDYRKLISPEMLEFYDSGKREYTIKDVKLDSRLGYISGNVDESLDEIKYLIQQAERKGSISNTELLGAVEMIKYFAAVEMQINLTAAISLFNFYNKLIEVVKKNDLDIKMEYGIVRSYLLDRVDQERSSDMTLTRNGDLIL